MQQLSRVVVCVTTLLSSAHAFADVGIAQLENTHDRDHQRLPDLNHLRGTTPRTIELEITADANEGWTLDASAAWLQLSPTLGTGPATVTLRFDGASLNALDDAIGTVTVTSTAPGTDAGVSSAALDVNIDVWPKTPPANPTSAELRAFLKDRANWPSDSSYAGGWELWGFLPDESTHPGESAGANMDAWEKTECPANDPNGDGCVSPGQAGLAAGQSADAAWLLSTGDERVIVAVLDSGIKWSERNLVEKHYLNASELEVCPPPGAGSSADLETAYDVNGDGVFSMRDYDRAEWLTDLNQNGMRDPQDLIHGVGPNGGPCSDGIDDDSDGYVDNISGWDFFWNDNDASDDTDYGHGTGEANDSVGAGHDGESLLGICPRCRLLNVRVGDSFIVDVNQFGDGTIFAVESGARVVQEALGSLNATPYMQAAIDYAYTNNVAVIASAADERSYHHNYPGNAEHTIYVHAIVADTDGDYKNAATFLNFGNCTNYGAKLMLSTPGTGCSSEATGKSSGQAGLVYSYFAQLRDEATGDDVAYYAPDLTAEELYQVLATSADDIDVPGMEADPAALEAKRYPSNEGWDLHFGYGRNNSRRSLEALRDKQIPPEADISAPRWFELVDPARTDSVEVRGTVSSPRLTNLRWRLLVADGVLGLNATEIATGTGAVDNGVLGTVDLTSSGPLADLVARAGDQAGDDPEKFTATLILEVTGAGPNGDVAGRFRKAFAVRRDPTMHDAFPIWLGASGESSPKLTDLDGDGAEEIVVGTSDGRVHAIRADGTELDGFPTTVNVYAPLSDAICTGTNPKCHRSAGVYQPGTEAGIDPSEIFSSIVATAAVGDLNGDGSAGRDVVVATMDGLIFAFHTDGTVMEGFPVGLDETNMAEFTGALTCQQNGQAVLGCRSKQRFGETGVFSSPMLVDLDRDGDLEIVVGGLDQWAYAWHHDGAVVNGWPVHLQNPYVPTYNDTGDIVRFDGRIISSPATCDIFGDGTPLVFMGTNERKESSNEAYLYGIWPDGNAHTGGAFPTGWPAVVGGFIPDEVLPFVGRGNPNSPLCVDWDKDGKEEVVNAGLGGFMLVVNELGIGTTNPEERSMESLSSYYGDNANVDEPLGSLPVINNPSVADLDGDGRFDVINGTAGLGLIRVASSGGQRAEFDHSVSAWIVDNGYFQEGFPHRVWDYQFFMNYAVADLESSGSWNVISGDGGYHIYAPNHRGVEAPGFPKFTSQWHIATPAVGDLDNDGRIDVVANTREGWLYAWSTEGSVASGGDIPAIQWASFHHDDGNTGNYHTPLPERQRILDPDDEPVCGCRSTGVDGAAEATGAAFVLLVAFIRRNRTRRS
jgi:hypothetical protein